jgi:hypothetical protein
VASQRLLHGDDSSHMGMQLAKAVESALHRESELEALVRVQDASHSGAYYVRYRSTSGLLDRAVHSAEESAEVGCESNYEEGERFQNEAEVR